MLISVLELERRHKIRPIGVLHLGAHLGEEAQDYCRHGWVPTWWVEANPALIDGLREEVLNAEWDHKVPASQFIINALVGANDGRPATLRIASNGQSSSVLPFGTHAVEHPEVTMTGEEVTLTQRSVDCLVEEHDIQADFVNLDLQGYELEALRGAWRYLGGQVRWVYTEVNKAELYRGCAQIEQIDDHLRPFGFRRAATRWTRHNWGDALYERVR